MPNEATTCLDTREAQERFRERYAEYVRAEAGKLSRDPARILELTDGVFDRMNKRYAARALPDDCRFALMAQLNLQYAGDALSVEGYMHLEEPASAAVHYTPNEVPSRRAERYAQRREEPFAPIFEPAVEAPRARKRRSAMTAAVVAAAEAASVAAPAPSAANTPVPPAPSAASPAVTQTPAAPSAPPVSAAPQDANYDPNSTILWTADAPFSPIAEVQKAQDEARFEQPEENPNARSVPITVINTLLFVLCIAAAIFLVLQMNIIPGFSLS